MPTQLEKAEEYLLHNPDATIKETAENTGVSEKTVSRARARLKGQGKAKSSTAKKGDSTFKQEKDGSAEYTFNTSKRIVSKEDLVAACDINLSEWKIERWICNKWEVGAKNASKEIVVTPLFQVKLWLVPLLTEKQQSLLDFIEDLVKRCTSGKIRKIKRTTKTCKKALKATVTDMHVGLDPNPNKRSLYGYSYGEKEFNENLDKVYNTILEERELHGKFDVLYINDLGDGLDGWNGLTTRGGHKLDQNLDNREQFRVYIEGKIRLIENLIEADVANRIEVLTVTDDNHAGDFSYVANWAIQKILERTYDKQDVNYIILQKFMEHFTYGEHTFILTHGKDSKNMFKGLPLELNEKAIKFITDYIRKYKITSKYIHLEKGDLHQVAYEKINEFDYRNFMAFAPPSNYVQNNHGDSYSGYSVQIIKDKGALSHTDYYFDVKISD